jgi:hypothetical protein
MTNGPEPTLRWRKSSHSGSGNNCVEVAAGNRHIAVRDSKDPHGRKLVISLPEWRAFVAGVKAGEFGTD